MSRESSQPAQKQMSTRMAIGLLIILIGYALMQPYLNKRFGLDLPTLPGLADQAGQEADEQAQPGEEGQEDSEGVADLAARSDSDQQQPGSSTSKDESNQPKKTELGKTSQSERGPPSDEKLRYGVLKSLGGENYQSPAGLLYVSRGSSEHRLEHLARHLKDIPDRRGPHGVFDGDMSQVLRWLDETYQLAEAGKSGAKILPQGNRTVYEAKFEKPVGYVGGSTGKRDGNPAAFKIKLVLEGMKVITAYPL